MAMIKTTNKKTLTKKTTNKKTSTKKTTIEKTSIDNNDTTSVVKSIRSRIWHCVINEPYGTTFDFSKKIDCAITTCRWFFILHDNDIYDEEDQNKNVKHICGTKKTKHIHLVISFNNARTSQQVIKYILNGCPSLPSNCVSVRNAKSIYASVQYLTHKNDESKYQYDFNKIMTNDVARLKYYYNFVDYDDVDIMSMILDDNMSQLSLIKTIGLKNYKKYAYAINNIYSLKEEQSYYSQRVNKIIEDRQNLDGESRKSLDTERFKNYIL